MGVLGQDGRSSVVTPPASDPITVDEVKKQLRIDHAAEDVQIDAMIKAAVLELDAPNGWLGRSLITRTLRLTLDSPPCPVVYLPGPPTTEVQTISYRNSDNDFVVIYDVGPPLVNEVDLQQDLSANPARIWPGTSWPSGIKAGPDSMRVDYVTGYADADAVPELIKQWLLMRVGDFYRDRETTSLIGSPSDIPHAVHMLDNLRVRT